MNVPGHTLDGLDAADRRAAGRDAARAPPTLLNAGKKIVILAGQGRWAPATSSSSSPRSWRAPIVKAAARQGCRARRLALHDRRHWPARDAPLREGDGGVRHAPDRRHQLPVHDLSAQAGPGEGRPDRPRPDAASACATRSTSAWPATPSDAPGPAPAAPATRSDRSFLEKAQERMKDWWELMDEREHARRHADEAAGRRAARQRTAGRRRDHLHRLGHDHDLGGPPHPDARGMLFSCSGNLATMAPGLPYAIAAQIAYPDRQVVAFVGDGGFTMLMARVRHGRQVQPADQGHRHQEQRARPDQVGADGLPGQPRVRRRAAADRLRQVRRGLRRRRVPLEQPEEIRPALELAFASTRPASGRGSRRPVRAADAGASDAKQAVHMAEALARGEPNRVKIAETIFRDKIKELV